MTRSGAVPAAATPWPSAPAITEAPRASLVPAFPEPPSRPEPEAAPTGDGTRVSMAAFVALEALLEHPEGRVRAEGLSLGLDPRLAVPFRIGAGRHVALAPSALIGLDAAPVLLGHAADLIRLAAARPAAPVAPARRIAEALIAARCAGLDLAALVEAERAATEAALPGSLLASYRTLTREDRLGAAALLLGEAPATAAELLRLAGWSEAELASALADLACRTEAANLFAGSHGLAVPAPVLLTSGGDQRTALVPATGRNGYGASVRPVGEEIAFSSSTASHLSPRQGRAVEALRARLLTAALEGRLEAAVETETETIRSGIAALAGVATLPGAEVVLTASGTDAEVVAMALAAALDPRPVSAVLIDASETGSGVPQAAAGTHFSTRTAQGQAVTTSGSIAGLAERCRPPVCVALRDAEGRPRPLAELDAEVEARVAEAIASGSRAVLHLVDAAKTGLGAPSIGCVDRLSARHRADLAVVVDACQMRLGAAAMRAYAERGWLVQITGSKFYCGPPFSGALIVPAGLAARLAVGAALPAGLAGYSAASHWPARLRGALKGLSEAPNPGLLGRWTAALAEAEAFGLLDPAEAFAVLARFATEARAEIGRHPELRAVEAAPFDRAALAAADPFQGLPTILPVLLCGPAGRPLSIEAAKRVHQLLMRDLTAVTRTRDAAVAGAVVHLGQPVRIGETGALRLCSSARVAIDAIAGRGPEAVLADMRTALAKMALAVRIECRTACG